MKLNKIINNDINLENNEIIFSLDTSIYSLEAVYSTAYVFIDRMYIYLDSLNKNEITVSLKGKEKLNKKQLEGLRGEFHNELLNYLLRVEIASHNQKIREYIVGTALVSSLGADLLASGPESAASEIENSDWQKDSLNIAVPWEEKYGKKKIKK